MIQLPDLRRDPKETADLCKCRPVCKSRRREWRGKVQNTSAELLLERKPKPECFRRCPTKVYPNSPCPLFGRARRVIIEERRHGVPTSSQQSSARVVRVCQAPIDADAHTPYLRLAALARRLGAWDAVSAQCAFCACCACCACDAHGYQLSDRERDTRRRSDMRAFDARVRNDDNAMRIMYDH